jgi:uncharacterized protein
MRMTATLLALAVAVPLGAQQPALVQQPQIVTSGQAETQITPDRARIFLTVETRAATAAAAADENARRQRTVIDRLRGMGIGSEQLGTSGFSVQPEYQYDPQGRNPPRVTGYVARNTIRAEVRQIDRIGPVIDAAIASGANSIGGLDFYSSNVESARRSALAEAVQKSRSDAEVMANAAGGRLGSLLELSTSSGSPPPPMPRFVMAQAAAVRAADTPINPGEQTLTVQVSARWLFIPR